MGSSLYWNSDVGFKFLLQSITELSLTNIHRCVGGSSAGMSC